MSIMDLAENTKIGKRLAKSEVGKLKTAISLLLDVAGYVEYTDELQELFAGLESESQKQNIDGDIGQALGVFLDAGEKDTGFGFKVLQGSDNAYLITWTTNAYEDREGEFFTLKSLQDYVVQNENRDNKGVYQFWHTQGSEFADIVAQAVSGKFLVEIGKFREDDIGKAFKEFFLKYPNGHEEIAPEGWGCSHGFVYQKFDREDGIYEWFDKKETTILPLREAANVYTLMEIL